MPSFKQIEEPVEVKIKQEGEKSAEEKPIEEKPVEVKPVEEKPADKPIEEMPVEVKPVEEKPADKPVEASKPAAEKPKPVVKLAHKKQAVKMEEDPPVEIPEPVASEPKKAVKLAHTKKTAIKEEGPKSDDKPTASDRGVDEKESSAPEQNAVAKKTQPKLQSVAQQKSTSEQGTGKTDSASYKELEEMSTFS